MRRAVFCAFIAFAVILAGAAGAAAPSPHALYQRLLIRSFPDSQLPSGFFSAKVGLSKPSKNATKLHVVGEVEVDVDGPDVADALLYVIFPTRSAALADLKHTQAPPGGKVAVEGKVPGYRIPSQWVVGSVTGNNAFGQKVTNGITGLFVVQQNVLIGAVTVSSDNTDSGNTPGALALLKAGLRHLAAASR